MAAALVDILVHGGRVVTASEVVETSVAIRGERIVALGAAEDLPEARHRIDATGKLVLPGLIDCHIHLGPEYDDWEQGARAAAHAGLTTLLAFGVVDDRAGETLPAAVERLRQQAARESVLDFGLHMILPNRPDVLGGVAEAVRLGVTSFKMFMTYKRRGNRMCSDEFICRAMETIARHGGLAQLHCENGDVLHYLEERALAEGRVAPRDFPATCPDWAEEEAIHRAVTFGALTGCPTYVVHLSTARGLRRIQAAQAEGQRVWTETCPQYLLLTEEAMERWGPFAKIGPPLRRADGPDREALWAGVAAGYIQTIGSDHAPRRPAEKQPGWRNIFLDTAGRGIPFGAPSVETLVPLLYSEGVAARGLSPTWLARVLAENPARIFGLYPQKGAIRVGADADLVILDPGATWTVRGADHLGIAGFSLYEGWPLVGRPWLTLRRGRVLLAGGELSEGPGSGRYLPRGGPQAPIGGSPA